MLFNILEHASDAIGIFDLENGYKLKYMNNIAKTLLRVPDGEKSLDGDWFFLNEKHFKEYLGMLIGQLNETGEFSAENMNNYTYDGIKLTVNIRGGFFDENKKLGYFIFNIVKEEQKEFSFRKMTEIAPIGIAIFNYNDDLKIKYGNKTYYEILGVKKDREEDKFTSKFINLKIRLIFDKISS